MQTCNPWFHVFSNRCGRNEGLEQMRRMQGRRRGTPAAKSSPSFEQNTTSSSLVPVKLVQTELNGASQGGKLVWVQSPCTTSTPWLDMMGTSWDGEHWASGGAAGRRKCFSAGDKPNQAALSHPKGELLRQWQASLSPFTIFLQRTASSHRMREQTAWPGPELTSRYDFYHS